MTLHSLKYVVPSIKNMVGWRAILELCHSLDQETLGDNLGTPYHVRTTQIFYYEVDH